MLNQFDTARTNSRQQGYDLVRYNFPNPMRRNYPILFLFLLALVVGATSASLAQSPAKPAPQDVPAVDGALGTCSLEVTVNTADGKPAYAASVKVHVAYGFGGFHKLDLEAGTNADGKVKFTGLPNRVRRPPLEFEATKNELVGVAEFDPAVQCRAQRTIVLDKASLPQEK